MGRNDIDWDRLDRYVSGAGTPEERVALAHWIASDPELRAIAAAMQSAGRSPDQPVHTWDVRAAWQKLHGDMRWTGRSQLSVVRSRSTAPHPFRIPSWERPRSRRIWATFAAAVVLCAVASGIALTRHSSGAAPPGVVAMREVTTHRGEIAVVELADGSRVTLGADSKLKAPAVDAVLSPGTVRNVYLEGQAYFEVKHDSAHPFRVHSAIGVVDDIGTEFVIDAYPELANMQVAVLSGSVALRDARRIVKARHAGAPLDSRPLLTLTRGDVAHLDSTGTATLKRDVDVASYVAWTKGTLVFDGTYLRDAIPQLERWYDVDIRLRGSSLATRRLTASFGNESLSQVIELLSLSLDARVERNGRTVTIAPAPRGKNAS